MSVVPNEREAPEEIGPATTEPEARSADRCVQLFQALQGGLIVVDHHLVIAGANAEAEQMFGYSSTEILNRPIATLLPHFEYAHRLDHDALMETPALLALLEVPTGAVCIRKDGSEFDAELSIAELEAEDTSNILLIVRERSPGR